MHVAYVNIQNPAEWETGREIENSYLVVTSADGGATWSPGDRGHVGGRPARLAPQRDGAPTVTSYQVRLWSPGNMSVGSDGTLFIVFADNRAGTHDVPNPISDMNVYVVSSGDGGATWTAPVGSDTGPTISGSHGET